MPRSENRPNHATVNSTLARTHIHTHECMYTQAYIYIYIYIYTHVIRLECVKSRNDHTYVPASNFASYSHVIPKSALPTVEDYL
jgi:hypothetical protein